MTAELKLKSHKKPHPIPVIVRNTRPEDFHAINKLCRRVYPNAQPWDDAMLSLHRAAFPEGQFVAAEQGTGRLLGMAASLIVRWDDYDPGATWRTFTAHGTFANHDPAMGRTLYGAEVMVDPHTQGRGVGKKIYAARRTLCRKLGLARIRAGSRLRGYARYADEMSAEQYVIAVIGGELRDATLSFQIKQGFRVIAVAEGYLPNDPDSRGHAAVIEWLNDEVATPGDRAAADAKFRTTHAG